MRLGRRWDEYRRQMLRTKQDIKKFECFGTFISNSRFWLFPCIIQNSNHTLRQWNIFFSLASTWHSHFPADYGFRFLRMSAEGDGIESWVDKWEPLTVLDSIWMSGSGAESLYVHALGQRNFQKLSLWFVISDDEANEFQLKQSKQGARYNEANIRKSPWNLTNKLFHTSLMRNLCKLLKTNETFKFLYCEISPKYPFIYVAKEEWQLSAFFGNENYLTAFLFQAIKQTFLTFLISIAWLDRVFNSKQIY